MQPDCILAAFLYRVKLNRPLCIHTAHWTITRSFHAFSGGYGLSRSRPSDDHTSITQHTPLDIQASRNLADPLLHSYFNDRQSRSMNTLSIQRPRPSIEIRTPASCSTLVKSSLVNWLPWSVLKIYG